MIVYLAPYSTAPGILALIGLEVLIAVLLAVNYIKRRYLRNIVLYISEIVRCAIMSTLLLIAYFYKYKRKNEAFDD